MLEISEAIRIVESETRPLGSETVVLSDAVGRVLRQKVAADTDLPPFDRSQMDGYAVIAADTQQVPARLTVVGESAAGRGWHKTMKSGQTVAIMTGAPVPAGADAVQKIELISEAGDGQIEIDEPTETGRHIVYKGSEVKKGETVFETGEIVTANMIAAIAAFGYAKVKLGKRPRVAIIGTGSEIVEIENKPGRDQIRNSNSIMLEIFCQRAGAEPTIVPIAKDSVDELSAAFARAADMADILVITGGVSVGRYDYTKIALTGLGAKLFFEKIRLKPGKPAVFAKLKKCFVFGLPGNPVSAAVTFHLFVRKAILALQGATHTDLRQGFATLGRDVKAAAMRDTYLPARLETTEMGHLVAYPLKWQGSSDFIGFARADSLIFVPRGSIIKKGEAARIAYL